LLCNFTIFWVRQKTKEGLLYSGVEPTHGVSNAQKYLMKCSLT
jgi:hypothetical protein